MRIAIQHDHQLLTSGRYQSFSSRASDFLKERGHEPLVVDVRDEEALFAELDGCDGFMWWFAHLPNTRRMAQRIVTAIEHGMGIPVFPSWKNIWHFDDKVAQHYLLRAAGIPTASTWVFWQQADALRFVESASYPLVLKLAGGIVSENVRLVRDAHEAREWTLRLFDSGLTSLDPPEPLSRSNARRRAASAVRLLRTGDPPRHGNRSEVQRDYVYLQEYLAGNDGDTRVTVIGNRAFAYSRFNRPDDFRASGSGLRDLDPGLIDPDVVRLAFEVARKLEMQSCAVDVLWKDGRPVIGEVSYYYESWIVAECPGHWALRGEVDGGALEWVPGSVWPEDAITADFLDHVRQRAEATPLHSGAQSR
jgi:hypothetical protein